MPVCISRTAGMTFTPWIILLGLYIPGVLHLSLQTVSAALQQWGSTQGFEGRGNWNWASIQHDFISAWQSGRWHGVCLDFIRVSRSKLLHRPPHSWKEPVQSCSASAQIDILTLKHLFGFSVAELEREGKSSFLKKYIYIYILYINISQSDTQ